MRRTREGEGCRRASRRASRSLSALPGLHPISLMKVDPIRVCFTTDYGFNMMNTTDFSSAISEVQVQGFDSDLRDEILNRRLMMPYELHGVSSYGELQVRTRSGHCDIGWSAFYQTSTRESCSWDPVTCANLTWSGDGSETGSGTSPDLSGDWEPYRCCADVCATQTPTGPSPASVKAIARSLV